MCGGSSPSGESKYTWNDDMAPRWGNTLNHAEQLSWDGFRPFQGQRFAGVTGDQSEAGDYTRNMARMSSNPLGATNAARGQIEDTLGGHYLSNPFNAPNQFQGMDNPYFNDVMQQGLGNIAEQYTSATEPEIRAQMVMNGTLGGGAHDQLRDKAQSNLAKQMGQFSSGMLNDQYNRSAGLDESALNRGSQNFGDERNRMMGAVGQGQNEQGLAYQRIGALQDFGGFMQGQQQQGMDFGYNQFQDSLNWPYKQFDFLTNLYGRAQGGLAPNQTMYSGGGNGVAQGAGGLMALASLFGNSAGG